MLDQQFPLIAKISKSTWGLKLGLRVFVFQIKTWNRLICSPKSLIYPHHYFIKEHLTAKKVEKNLRMCTSSNHLSLIKNTWSWFFSFCWSLANVFKTTFKIDLPVAAESLSTCVKDWGRLRSLLLRDLGRRGGDADGRETADDWSLLSLIAWRRS